MEQELRNRKPVCFLHLKNEAFGRVESGTVPQNFQLLGWTATVIETMRSSRNDSYLHESTHKVTTVLNLQKFRITNLYSSWFRRRGLMADWRKLPLLRLRASCESREGGNKREGEEGICYREQKIGHGSIFLQWGVCVRALLSISSM